MSLLAALIAVVLPIQEPPARPEVAVVTVTLDQLRQGQEQYGRGTLASLGHPEWGRIRFADAGVGPERFESCADDRMDAMLDYCIRFYLTRAELAEGPPTVVVVMDDQPSSQRRPRGGEMRVSCFGRGLVPADAAAQDIALWPGAARMHGVSDLNRDKEALEACIAAAASEPFAGLRQPDRRP